MTISLPSAFTRARAPELLVFLSIAICLNMLLWRIVLPLKQQHQTARQSFSIELAPVAQTVPSKAPEKEIAAAHGEDSPAIIDPPSPLPKAEAQKLPKTRAARKASSTKTANTDQTVLHKTIPTQAKSVMPDSQPRPLASNRRPAYPELARKRQQQGEAVLRCEIDKSGVVANVVVSKSSGHKLLDEAALKAARQWLFAPAIKNGKPASGSLLIPIKFVLQ